MSCYVIQHVDDADGFVRAMSKHFLNLSGIFFHADRLLSTSSSFPLSFTSPVLSSFWVILIDLYGSHLQSNCLQKSHSPVHFQS